MTRRKKFELMPVVHALIGGVAGSFLDGALANLSFIPDEIRPVATAGVAYGAAYFVGGEFAKNAALGAAGLAGAELAGSLLNGINPVNRLGTGNLSSVTGDGRTKAA